MKSPITGKEMILKQEPGVLSYRKESFNIIYHFYLCEDSGERFTDDVLDGINMVQVFNQYREKYRIPFPEEIAHIREKYNVSANKMSEILGLGANTYRLYEAGEMPSVSNGRLIMSVKEPGEFLRQVEASAHLLTSKEVDRIKESVRKIQENNRRYIWELMFEEKIFGRQIPDEFTGYKEPQLNKVAQVIAYFTDRMDLFKTKLNKLLYYSDFCYYKKTGYSMTGIAYRAVNFGPVPSEYEKMYVKLVDDEKIEINQVEVGNGHYGEIIRSVDAFDQSYFTPIGLQVLESVCRSFKSKTTDEIVQISHNELAWKENYEDKRIISYQKYAFLTEGVDCQ